VAAADELDRVVTLRADVRPLALARGLPGLAPTDVGELPEGRLEALALGVGGDRQAAVLADQLRHELDLDLEVALDRHGELGAAGAALEDEADALHLPGRRRVAAPADALPVLAREVARAVEVVVAQQRLA